MKVSRFRSNWGVLFTSVALLAGCGAGELDSFDSETGDLDEAIELDEATDLGTTEEALNAACGGDDSNSLTASLAVAIANELGRWDVSTDFVVSNGKLELSPTGLLHCGSNCKNITALLRLQDDAASIVPNHSPSTYRNKLTGWYGTQKTELTNMVNTMLKVDEGIYQIQFKPSGKLIAPQGGSTTAGALVQQTDQLWGNTAAQWKVMLNGTLRQIINVKSGQCLDSSGTSLVQKTCNGSSTQGFRFAQLAAGVLSIRTATNQALQIPNSSTANGATVVQGTVAGQAPEQFAFIANGGGATQLKLLETATAVYSLKFKHSNMGLAVSSMSLNDGVSVVQQPYSATDDRFHWYITQIGTWWFNGVEQTRYQYVNRATGKCLDLASSSMGTNLVQKTCSTAETQRFLMTPTGGGHQVIFTNHGWPAGVQNGSTGSGAQIVEANVGWQYYNMMTPEPILAGEPHRLSNAYTTNDGPCGKYNWYNITQQNGTQLANPASTFVQLIFAGGKTTLNGTDANPYIAQKVQGNQVAIDPAAYMNGGSGTTSGSCLVADIVYDTTGSKNNLCCVKYNGGAGVLKVSAWSSTTYVCQ
ncbi:MAG TPA: RICIN domain-containing protein [Polyangiaceae bacterium]|nr:RICIN domain-containing protein [Polyangiaceae bacterium]